MTTPAEKLAAKKKANTPRGFGSSPKKRGPWKCKLRDKRREVGLSAADVAKAVRFSNAGMSKIENGSDPMLTTAYKFAAFFGVSVAELRERATGALTTTTTMHGTGGGRRVIRDARGLG